MAKHSQQKTSGGNGETLARDPCSTQQKSFWLRASLITRPHRREHSPNLLICLRFRFSIPAEILRSRRRSTLAPHCPPSPLSTTEITDTTDSRSILRNVDICGEWPFDKLPSTGSGSKAGQATDLQIRLAIRLISFRWQGSS